MLWGYASIAVTSSNLDATLDRDLTLHARLLRDQLVVHPAMRNQRIGGSISINSCNQLFQPRDGQASFAHKWSRRPQESIFVVRESTDIPVIVDVIIRCVRYVPILVWTCCGLG